MLRKFKVLIVAAMMAALVGCAGQSGNQVGGSLLGAAAGGLAGSMFGGGTGLVALAVLGSVTGSAIGQSIGGTMDPKDQGKVASTLEVVPSGQAVVWNSDNGNEHRITPTRTFSADNGAVCREFTHNVLAGSEASEAQGTACRQADGSWNVTG